MSQLAGLTVTNMAGTEINFCLLHFLLYWLGDVLRSGLHFIEWLLGVPQAVGSGSLEMRPDDLAFPFAGIVDDMVSMRDGRSLVVGFMRTIHPLSAML